MPNTNVVQEHMPTKKEMWIGVKIKQMELRLVKNDNENNNHDINNALLVCGQYLR